MAAGNANTSYVGACERLLQILEGEGRAGFLEVALVLYRILVSEGSVERYASAILKF